MTRFGFTALAAGLAVLAPAAPPPVGGGGQPAPVNRIHLDFARHSSTIDALFFRDKDRELVSVGTDDSVRVWSVRPDNGGPPRCRAVYWLPRTPMVAALCRTPTDDKFLAVGLKGSAVGTANAQVRVIDLTPGVPPANLQTVIDIPSTAVNALRFSRDGLNLLVGGPSGQVWRWTPAAWNPLPAPNTALVTVNVPRELQKCEAVIGLAFAPNDRFVAVVGQKKGAGGNQVFVAPWNGTNPGVWQAMSLPEADAVANAVDWSDDGLAVGYHTTKSGAAAARVAVFPTPNGGMPGRNPISRVVQPNRYTKQLAWLPGRPGILLVGLDSDIGLTDLPRQFQLNPATQTLDDVAIPAAAETIPGSRTPGGVSAVAAGALAGPTFAWGGATLGNIQVVHGGAAVPLPNTRTAAWVTRLDWDQKTSKLILTSPQPGNGAAGPVGRADRVWNKALWAYLKLDAARNPRPGFQSEVELITSDNPEYTRVTLPNRNQVSGTATRLALLPPGIVGNPMAKVTPPVLKQYPGGVQHVLAFDQPNVVVALGNDGRLTFWDHGGGTTLMLMATAEWADDGKLWYRTTDGDTNLATRVGRPKVETLAGPDASAVVGFGYLAGEDNRWEPWFAYGLDPGTPILPGPTPFAVQMPAAGKLTVRVRETIDVGGKEEVRSVVLQPTTGGNPAAGQPCWFQHEFPKGKHLVEATFQPNGDVAQGYSSRVVQAEEFGRVFIFDITPQQPGCCTEAEAPPPPRASPHRPTAGQLRKLLEGLDRVVVDADTEGWQPLHAATTEAAYKNADLLTTGTPHAPKVQPINGNDTVILLLKGHGDFVRKDVLSPPILDTDGGPRVVFKTDDYNHARALQNGKTGLYRNDIQELIKRFRRVVPHKVVVILDCCNADAFLGGLSGQPVSYFPGALAGELAESAVIPGALQALCDGPHRLCPSGSPALARDVVYQDDLLRALRHESELVAKEMRRATRYGLEQPYGRFVIGRLPPRPVAANPPNK